MATKITDDEQAEIHTLMRMYESMIEVVQEMDNPTLRRLSNSWEMALSQLKERLEESPSRKELRAMRQGLRQGLRELPDLLPTISDCDAPKVLASIESALGFKLSDFLDKAR
jgi:hypothetical protein